MTMFVCWRSTSGKVPLVAAERRLYCCTGRCETSAKPHLNLRPAGNACLEEEYRSPWNSSNVPQQVFHSVKMWNAVNKFHVPYKRRRQKFFKSRDELQREVEERVALRTVRAGDGPFSGDDWDAFLPKKDLRELLGPMKRCAVVMSSGSMRDSSLGSQIDEHDAVIRFNAAPTKGFSADVGNKTTLRLINSQLMTVEAKFLSNPLYHTGVLIVWDPAPYSRDLYAWYKKPDFNFFPKYKEYRKAHPEQPFYILSPSVQWDLWDVIQENSETDIQPNPPSSGMLGITVMMSLCEEITIYEFLPSRRRSDLCYYFKGHINKQCTIGHYHPLTFEKMLIKRLNRGHNCDIHDFGKVSLCGYSRPTSAAHESVIVPGLTVHQEERMEEADKRKTSSRYEEAAEQCAPKRPESNEGGCRALQGALPPLSQQQEAQEGHY
ncbi:beta-galactoside alpha-2,6-sialyltransferase 1-like [Scleropages formosus]|uniref:beta-galactoside alpha-2,6-sialyltransferase 1-like n=1 Tax=Scleropages formosus TaxID=113540 RepID=UPI0008790286|nr:beta-galactoside alpha-2,6-sialyltransferase 1-like [Scleropages formosus]